MRKVAIPLVILVVLASVVVWERVRVHREKLAALDHAAAELHAAQSLGMVQIEHATLLRDVFAEYDVLQHGNLNDAEQKLLLGYPQAIEVCRSTREVWGGFEIVPLPFNSKHNLYSVKVDALLSLSSMGVPEVPPKLYVTEIGRDSIVQIVLGTCDTALQSAREGGDQAQVKSALRNAIGSGAPKLQEVFRISADMRGTSWFRSYVKD